MTTKVKHGVTEFLPGQVIQSVYAETLAATVSSTLLPVDDTIPQITEGAEVLTASITPKYATSKIRVRFTGFVTVGTGGTNVSAALFRDAVANAIAAVTLTPEALARYNEIFYLEAQDSPASVSAITYRIRIGPGTGGVSVCLNGDTTSGRYFGGVARSTLVVEEVAA
jgi:hypothetical protein